MNKIFLLNILYFTHMGIAFSNDQEINEGHLYHIEVEEDLLKVKRLRKLFGADELKVYSNCFSDNYAKNVESKEPIKRLEGKRNL